MKFLKRSLKLLVIRLNFILFRQQVFTFRSNIVNKNPSLYSFDIFDTLVTRLVFRPEDAFSIVGRELLLAGLINSRDEFFKLRQDSELVARKLTRYEEISLNDIYIVLSKHYNWDAEQALRAQSIEVNVEIQLTSPIHQNIEQIKRLVNEEKKGLAFISDIYLSLNAVIAILTRAGIENATRLPIFLSSEYRVTKAKGKLYNYAKEVFCSANFHHTGDNLYSDVFMAKKSGVFATHFCSSMNNRYEKSLYLGRAPLNIRTAIAGASRATRLSKHIDNKLHQVIWDTGSNVFGPLICAYVIWLLLDSKKRGFSHLFFVARDGKIMFEVAQRLESWLNTGIELRYIHGSRNAWHIPALSCSEIWPSWAYDVTSETTLTTLISRVGLKVEEVKDLAPELDLNSLDLTAPVMSSNSLKRCWLMMLGHKKIRNSVIAKSTKSRVLLEDYLIEQGVNDLTNFVIVDIGWNGRMQQSLRKVFDHSTRLNPVKIFGYYLAMVKNPPPSLLNYFSAFFLEGDAEVGACAVHQNRVLAEIMCRADHGGTLCYSYNETLAKTVPVLKDYDPQFDAYWGLGIQRSAILTFSEKFSKVARLMELSPENVISHLKFRAGYVWSMLIENPSFLEAKAFGTIPHGQEQIHSSGYSLAPVCNLKSLIRALFASPRVMRKYTSWPQATVTLSSQYLIRDFFRIMFNVKMFFIYWIKIAISRNRI